MWAFAGMLSPSWDDIVRKAFTTQRRPEATFKTWRSESPAEPQPIRLQTPPTSPKGKSLSPAGTHK